MKTKLLTILILMLGANLYANEGGGAPPAESTSSTDKPWLEVQNKISGLRTKSKQNDEKLKELIKEKLHGANGSRLKELDREIEATYQDWKKSLEELKKQNQIYKFRYPERAAQSNVRVYDVNEVPSLKKIEEQIGIDGKLQRNMKKMRGQYGLPKNLAKTRKELHVSEEPKEAEKSPTIRESDSPVLKK